jgi:nitrogen fixation NifU-like protein
MYSAQVLDHFEHPRNAGEVRDADASVQVENPACGDVLQLSAKLVDGHIADIRFRAKGCVPSMACASLLTEMVKGRTLQQARLLRREQLLAAAGGLPPASTHAGHLALDALAQLLNRLPPADKLG